MNKQDWAMDLHGDTNGMGGVSPHDPKARADIEAIKQIGDLLDEFYPDVRIAILEYCLIIANKDAEG